MRHLLLPLAMPLVLLACEPIDSAPTVPEPTGAPASPPTVPSVVPIARGVQVGSEGIVPSGCSTQVLDDPADWLERIGLPADRTVGAFASREVNLGTSSGTVAVTPVEWIAVGGGCPPSLVAEVLVALDLDDLQSSLPGYVSIGTDSLVVASLASGIFTGEREPRGLPDDTPVVLLAAGELDPTLALTMAFQACSAPADCEQDPLGILTTR